MERRPSLAMVCVVLGLLMGTHLSMADFQMCYGSCFVLCVFKPGENVFKCAYQCLKDCLLPPSASPPGSSAVSTLSADRLDASYFCTLGCSTSMCTHFSTKTNPELTRETSYAKLSRECP
ncbi:hypothetical protein CRG98_028624 [Punica granatum]|uniref:Thionin-like protein 2 n=1 Tax=Punica granatum TaxID=22663 RepID=A0A2I0J436_PUNGR|nr:hypothetical protein CRG98_028624 [Punica granatum]